MRVLIKLSAGEFSPGHRILVLALLQLLLMIDFSNAIGAAKHNVDMRVEMQRSMARYRHLTFEQSQRKVLQAEENKVERLGKEFESPTAPFPNKNPELHQQQQGDKEKGLELHSKRADQPEKRNDEPSKLYLKLVQFRGSEVDKDIEEEVRTYGREFWNQPIGDTEKGEPFVFPEPYLLGAPVKDWDEQRSSWLEKNAHMKSTVNKPRVLIVSGSQPKPCASPVGDHFHLKSLKLKIDYARMHGYEFYYNFAWLDPLFGHYWVKLPVLRKLMLTHPEIEWFFWVDSDAVFTDMLFEPPFHTYEGYNMVMWGWEYGLYTNRSWVAFNAGVFLLRNCQWSLDLIDKWSPMGPKGRVRVEYGKILTSFLSQRKANFPADDQSALAYLLITDETLRSKVKLVESDSYTMSKFWPEVENSLETCMEKYHPGLGDYRWPWITHFTGCGPCTGGDNPEYDYDRCLENMERAYNFADNQVLAYQGYQHQNLSSPLIF